MSNLTQEAQKAYEQGQAASGIAPGDMVRVIRRAETHELGWNNSWYYLMDSAVGKTYFVSAVYGVLGVSLKGADGYSYPYFVLELVKKAAQPKHGDLVYFVDRKRLVISDGKGGLVVVDQDFRCVSSAPVTHYGVDYKVIGNIFKGSK